MEMIERVARAICEVSCAVSDPRARCKQGCDCWDHYRDHAAAAIKAMREPTDAMVGAAERVLTEDLSPSAHVTLDEVQRALQVSVDAALGPQADREGGDG